MEEGENDGERRPTTHGSLPQIVENKEMDEYHLTNMENQFFGGGDNSNNNFDDDFIGGTYYHNEEEKDATLVKLAERAVLAKTLFKSSAVADVSSITKANLLV